MSDNNIHKSQSAKKAHQKLVILLEKMRRYEQSALLVFSEIMHQKLYEQLGYSSMHNYATDALKIPRSTAFQYISLTKKLETLPETRKAVESGELGWTKAKEVAKVATPDSEVQWVAEAKKSSRLDFSIKAKQAKQIANNESKQQPELIPSELLPKADPKVSTSLSFSVEQMERFNALIEKMRKQGETGTREELLIKALTDSTAQNSPRGENAPSTQIVIRHCPECEKAETGAGEISQNDLEKAYCDAQVLENGRNKATIKPSTRREVMSRDNHTCQGQGCSSKRYLEIHHKIPRSQGGNNSIGNLITLCSACHSMVHSRGRFVNQHKGKINAQNSNRDNGRLSGR
ncbi:MAG: HNH endonuclease [bacterium]|nr:HNH endonuclease [bacterium]